MGETDNIAKVADRAFAEIFKVFGWKIAGPRNVNWPCITKHKEAQPKRGHHPTDAVYGYNDPYRAYRSIVDIDFKSYSEKTLENVSLKGALRSLANSVDCANKSEAFQDKYYEEGVTCEAVGLLFVYNHDNAYDPTKFRRVLKNSRDAMDMAKGRRMYVMGPEEILYLLNVSTDVRVRFEDEKTFDRSFFNPNLIGRPARGHDALSIETLLGPWQVQKSVGSKKGEVETRYCIYCRSDGSTLEEFEYLFDFCFRFGFLDDHSTVTIAMQHADENAPVLIEKAKDSYVRRLHGLTEIRERLDRIKFRAVSLVYQQFHTIALGMVRD